MVKHAERWLATGLLALGLGFGAAAQAQTGPLPARQGRSGTALPATAVSPLAGIVGDALRTHQLVHLGDTDHRDNHASYAWLGDPATLRALSRDGVGALYLEMSQNLQFFADALAMGQTDEASFVDDMSEMSKPLFRDPRSEYTDLATLIVNAHKAGIAVYFADPDNGKNELFQADAILRRNGQPSLPEFEALPADAEDAVLARLPAADRAAFRDRIAAVARRIESDGDLAAFIARTLHGRKGVLFYGAAHGSGLHDLNELLTERGVRSTKIDLFADEADYTSAAPVILKAADPPAASYILGSGRYSPTPAPVPVPVS